MIPEHVLAAYVERYPHLETLVRNVRIGNLGATRTFAQVALRLRAPAEVSARDLWDLSASAMCV